MTSEWNRDIDPTISSNHRAALNKRRTRSQFESSALTPPIEKIRIYAPALWWHTEKDCGNSTCAEATEKRSAQDVTNQSKALFLMKNTGWSKASVGSERIC